jgi:GNAT superfamily N-acetyltransferase
VVTRNRGIGPDKAQSGGHCWECELHDQAAEPSDWEAVRDIRLRSLREEPDAYASEYQTEARFEPNQWKQRLAIASSYLAFDDDHALVGIATGLVTGDGDTYVVGMYLTPEARGSGCARQLLDAIARAQSVVKESA